MKGFPSLPIDRKGSERNPTTFRENQVTDPTALTAWRKERERRDRESWERRPTLRLPLPPPETVPERGESKRGVAEITFTL